MPYEYHVPISKPWYKSKTVWSNMLVGGLGVLEASTGILKPHIDKHLWLAGVVVGAAVLNVVLRTVTTSPITRK